MLADTDWAARVQCNGTSHSCFHSPLHGYLPDCQCEMQYFFLQACEVSSMSKAVQCMVRADSKNWWSPPDIALLSQAAEKGSEGFIRCIWKTNKQKKGMQTSGVRSFPGLAIAAFGWRAGRSPFTAQQSNLRAAEIREGISSGNHLNVCAPVWSWTVSKENKWLLIVPLQSPVLNGQKWASFFLPLQASMG